MQIDVNSAADRAHLMHAQLTSLRSAQLNPKTPVSTDGRAVTSFVSARGKLTDLAPAPVKLTDLVSRPGRNISDVREHPSVSPRPPTVVPVTRTVQPDGTRTTSPTPRRIAGPAGDLRSLDRAPAKTPITVAPERPEPINHIDALLADWDKKDSPYDLDGNGIVGVNDLLILLARLTSGGSQPPQEPHGDVAAPRRLSSPVRTEPLPQPNTRPDHAPVITSGDPVAIGVKATTIAQHVIDQLDRDNSGTIAPPEVDGSTPRFDRLDRNHDGALSRSELAARIRGMLLDHIAMSPNAKLDQFVREAMKRLSEHDNRNGAPGERDGAVQRSSQAYQRMNLQETVQKFLQRLTDDGPSDLANFVQAGKLSENDTKVVINQLSMLSPNKLGVNVVG